MSSIGTWLRAHDEFKKARDKEEGRPVSRGTRLVISRDSPEKDWKSDRCVYAIRYHYSEVVKFYPNGEVGVSMCDWDTKTTKERIKDHSDCAVWTSKGITILARHLGLQQGFLSFPIDTSKEYVLLRNGHVRLPSGEVVDRGAVRCPAPRAASKTRDRVKNPVAGEVLVSPEGVPYIVFAPSKGAMHSINPLKTLKRYLGDYCYDRDFVFVDDEAIEMNELFTLSMLDWTSGSRFVRSFDN